MMVMLQVIWPVFLTPATQEIVPLDLQMNLALTPCLTLVWAAEELKAELMRTAAPLETS